MSLPENVSQEDIQKALKISLNSRRISVSTYEENRVPNFTPDQHWQQGRDITGEEAGKYIFLRHGDWAEMNTGALGSQFGRLLTFISLITADIDNYKPTWLNDTDAGTFKKIHDEVKSGKITHEEFCSKMAGEHFYRWQDYPYPARIVTYMDELSRALYDLQSDPNAQRFGYKATLEPTHESQQQTISDHIHIAPGKPPISWPSKIPAWVKSTVAASLLAGGGLASLFNSNRQTRDTSIEGQTTLTQSEQNALKWASEVDKEHAKDLQLLQRLATERERGGTRKQS